MWNHIFRADILGGEHLFSLFVCVCVFDSIVSSQLNCFLCAVLHRTRGEQVLWTMEEHDCQIFKKWNGDFIAEILPCSYLLFC